MINETHFLLLKAHLDFECDITRCDELWDNYSSTGHRVALVEVGSVGAGLVRFSKPLALGSGLENLTRAGPALVATWALAPLFVTKMVEITTLIFNQNGAKNPKKSIVTEMLLMMNPTEHTGWIIVDALRNFMTQAQISAVTIARPVTTLPKIIR